MAFKMPEWHQEKGYPSTPETDKRELDLEALERRVSDCWHRTRDHETEESKRLAT